LSSIGIAAIYHDKIFTQELVDDFAKNKSLTTNGKSKEAFFLPEARIKQTINYAKHANTLNLCFNEKFYLINNIFFDGLTSATKEYRYILENEKVCINYCIKSRQMKAKEFISIGFNFYNKFMDYAKKDVFSNSYSFFLKFKLLIILKLLARPMQKPIKSINKRLCNIYRNKNM